AVVHCDRGRPTIVGRRATIGHHALLEGCVIDEGAVVGMGAIVLHDAHVGAGAILAAGAVLPDRGTVGAGMLAAGVPAREKRPLEGATRDYPERAADEYQDLRERYLTAGAASQEPRRERQGTPAIVDRDED